MNCCMYILKNQQQKFYIGITKLDPVVRLKRHNKGDIYSTKLGKPWKLFYTELFDSYINARIREKQIKSWHGGNSFRKLIASAAGSSNGRT